MPADSKSFTIGTFALWAGDFVHFESLMRDFAPPREVASREGQLEQPEDLMRIVGALRLRQLRQRRGEFKKMISQEGVRGVALTDQPLVRQTTHLRATVWRLDEREFVMRAYLTDLAWEAQLFGNARIVAATRRLNDPPEPAKRPDQGPSRARDGERSYEPLGSRWVVPGSLFIQAELTDLGLLEATGLWTERALPEAADLVARPFLDVVESLEDADQPGP